MTFLKNLPVKYIGELHHIKLINFSVEKSEIEPYLPAGIKIRDYNGRALISMVNVDLRKMRPVFFPKALHFSYRHIAFRLLIDDSAYNNGENKGIYFYRSFTDKPVIVTGGKILTIYKLDLAQITEAGNTFELRSGKQYLRYSWENKNPCAVNEMLQKEVAAVDRAYCPLGKKLKMVEIQREKWPIEWMCCKNFETTFFTTARFEGAFYVKEKIDYQWLPLKNVAL